MMGFLNVLGPVTKTHDGKKCSLNVSESTHYGENGSCQCNILYYCIIIIIIIVSVCKQLFTVVVG